MCKPTSEDVPSPPGTRTEPYSFWFHPHVSFLDMLLQMIICFIGGLYAFPRYSPNPPRNPELEDRLERSRRVFTQGYDYDSAPHVQKWGSAMGGKIVEHTLLIPRDHNILVRWGIVTQQEKDAVLGKEPQQQEGLGDGDPPSHVEIRFRFPAKLLRDETAVATEKNKNGSYSIDELDIQQLLESNKSVPVVVYYHGGGLTVGANTDSVGVEFMSRPSTQANKPLIMASVSYHLAPEHPFPTAIEDALSGFSFLADIMLNLHQNEMRKIPLHVAGPSAGGHLATIVAMESHRRLPGLVKSAFLMCPMLDPAADSGSYYLNSKSSWVASVPWLRWCYQGYLRLEKEDELLPGQGMNDLPFEERVRIGSNQTAFAKSKWSGTSYERLVRPMAELPPEGLENTHVAPNILVTTQEADPLRDEGFEFVEELWQKGMLPSKLKHIHTNGSHHVGLALDFNATKQVTAWCIESFFPNKA